MARTVVHVPPDTDKPLEAEAPPFLPSTTSQDLSAFEFALITLMFGFQSWVQDCMDAAGVRGLSPMDILVLHAVNHRARDHRQADICRVLNIDDGHLVAYALKKLLAAGLVAAKASGRERRFSTTAEGEAACLAYRRVRETHLVPSLAWVAGRDGALRDASGLMGTLTALYAQAGRGATASTAGLARPARVHTKR